MTSQKVNLIIGLALILAIVGTAAAGVITLILHGTWDPKITDIIVMLGGLLMSFRHVNDIKAGNGASGTQPTDTP